jgi:hypothetical protein
MNSIRKPNFLSPTLNKNLRFNNSKLFLHLKWYLTIMLIILVKIWQQTKMEKTHLAQFKKPPTKLVKKMVKSTSSRSCGEFALNLGVVN